MQIGIIGLGKMGMQIARRFHKKGVEVIAWNRSKSPREEFEKTGGKTVSSVKELVDSLTKSPKIIWLMLPAGDVVDDFLFEDPGIAKMLDAGDMVIDGGNSFFRDTMKRAEKLKEKDIIFFDSGTSGGIHGQRQGFSVMVGGPKEHWNKVEPFFKILAEGDEGHKDPKNYGLVGRNGAGHFVKMVHNGIEYGMMEAIGEGFAVMKESEFGDELDYSQVAEIWSRGSVISSWLIELTKNIFDTENLDEVAGYIHHTGEGMWTVEEAKKLGVDVRVIEESFKVRKESEDPGNQDKFSNKIVALLRKQFGGHDVKKK